MTVSDLDLLRERRAQLGLPEPDTSDPLVPLLKGAVLGGALVGVALLASGLMMLLNRSTAAEVERLTPVQGQFDALQAQIKAQRGQRLAIEKASTDLAQALVAVRSGSALMEDLRRRAPQGVQFTEARVEGDLLRLKGLASDPGAFARINALQLNLQRSPLFDPKKVVLVKANREEPKNQPQPGDVAPIPPVLFELTVGFRPLSGGGDLATLRLLGADGMATRLQKLQREGLLR
jgi:type IV pilus assembly protein PilN